MIMSGSNLETCTEIGTGIEGVKVGRIEKIEPHPDADKLVICRVNIGQPELLQLVTGAGIFSLILSVILGIQTIVRYASGHAVEGFTTVILLILLLGSIVMISLGIIGYYISQIYEEVKARPRYIISDMTGYGGET